jgi:hypothetical protein
MVKSDEELVEILAVLLNKKAEEVLELLNKVKSFPFILRTDPSTSVTPPPEIFPTNKLLEPPLVDNKIVFAVVD